MFVLPFYLLSKLTWKKKGKTVFLYKYSKHIYKYSKIIYTYSSRQSHRCKVPRLKKKKKKKKKKKTAVAIKYNQVQLANSGHVEMHVYTFRLFTTDRASSQY